MKLTNGFISGLWLLHNRNVYDFAAAIESEAYKLGQADMRERATNRCLMERKALDENEEVWTEHPTMLPDQLYIDDWESSACRGEEYAEVIRLIPIEELSE